MLIWMLWLLCWLILHSPVLPNANSPLLLLLLLFVLVKNPTPMHPLKATPPHPMQTQANESTTSSQASQHMQKTHTHPENSCLTVRLTLSNFMCQPIPYPQLRPTPISRCKCQMNRQDPPKSTLPSCDDVRSPFLSPQWHDDVHVEGCWGIHAVCVL